MPFTVILSLLPELLKAATAALKVLPLVMVFKVRKGIREYEDEIIKSSISSDPSDRLRIIQLEQRRQEDSKLLSSLRSACGDVN